MPNENAGLADVIAWYSENAPGSLRGMRDPAPAAEYAQRQLPTDVLELYSLCDGEVANSVGILPDYRLLPRVDAIAFRDIMIGITTAPVLDEEPRYSGFTRSEIEASGLGLTEDVTAQAEDGEWEERELQRAGEMLVFFHGSADDYRSQQSSELDGYRFTEDHLPIAQWDSACIAVEISSGLVFVWEPVDGRSHSWPSLGAMFTDLLAALTGGSPFLWRIPVVVGDAVGWEFDESALEPEHPAPSSAEFEPEAASGWHDVIEFFIDLTTFAGVADYLGGEDRRPASTPFEALESADFTTPQSGRVTILAFADSAQADAFRAFAQGHSLHIATIDDVFAIVADTAEIAADLQSSVTFD